MTTEMSSHPDRRRSRSVDGGLDRRRRDHRLDLRRADAALRGRRADPGDRDLHRARRAHGGRAGRVGDGEQLAACRSSPSWPGKFMDEMPGMSFGHAGTIVEGKADTAAEKIARLRRGGHHRGRGDRRDPRPGEGQARAEGRVVSMRLRRHSSSTSRSTTPSRATPRWPPS